MNNVKNEDVKSKNPNNKLNLYRFDPDIYRIRYINNFKKLNIDGILCGSTFLVACGLIKANNDIDAIVPISEINKYKDTKNWKYNDKNMFYDNDKEHCSITEQFLNVTYADCVDTAVNIDNIRFVHPKIMYSLYSQLNREKDQEKLNLYTKYFKDVL